MIRWRSTPTSVPCPVCGHGVPGSVVGDVGRDSTALTVVRCETCGTIVVVGADGEESQEPAELEPYLMVGANVHALVHNLYRGGTASRSVLDIGCGFGFAVAYADRILGWRSTGIDASASAALGGEYLGLDIRNSRFGVTTDLGETFDLVVGSAVLELVADPAGFLAAARRHLSREGVLVLTTPRAERVSAAFPLESSHIVGEGDRRQLFSRDGLERLLAETGFESVRIDDAGLSWVVVAAVRAGRDLGGDAQAPADDLARFYDELATSSQPLLSAAGAVRSLAHAVASGDRSRMETGEADAVRRISELHGADVSTPAALGRFAATAAGGMLPGLASLAHSAGMVRLIAGTDAQESAEYFQICDDAIARSAPIAADLTGLQKHARRHRLLALARTSPIAAVAAAGPTLADAPSDVAAEWTLRLASELTARDALEEAATLDGAVADALAEYKVLDAHSASVVLDAIRGIATRAIRAGERWSATCWLAFEEDLLLEVAEGFLDPDAVSVRLDSIVEERRRVASTTDVGYRASVPGLSPRLEELLWSRARTYTTEVPGKISVVMPLYNGEGHVERALDSIVAQTHEPLEVLLVDDGSSDDGLARALLAAPSLRIRVIPRLNTGQSGARNRGIRAARGEFIAFLDQDDVWRRDHLAVLHDVIAGDPDVAWAFSDFDVVDGAGSTLQRHYVGAAGMTPRSTLEDVLASDLMALPSASVLRRRALLDVNGFDRRLIGYEDDDLYVRLFRAGWLARTIPDSTVRYRAHSEGASASPLFLRSRLIFLRTLVDEVPDNLRLGRFPVSDHALPRFWTSSLWDYAFALGAGDLALARTIAGYAREISQFQKRVGLRRRAGLAMMDLPRSMRRLLAVVARLPRPLRPRLHPAFYESESRRRRLSAR